MKSIKIFICSLALAYLVASCGGPDGNFPGSEYMPDMAHSVAYEANTLDPYYYNTWDEESRATVYDLAMLNQPVEGTIPRGYAGVALSANAEAAAEVIEMMNGTTGSNVQAITMNGSAPYYYANTPEGRLNAMANLTENPFPITEAGLEQGEFLYNTFCGICHGESGNGLGYLYNEEENPNAKYPAAPASFLTDEFLAATNGRYYHAIMYGYNVMGAYADKMSYEERWQVIHYIRSLQADAQELEYSAEANTLNPSFGTPASIFDPLAARELSNFSEQLGAAGSAETEVTDEGLNRK
ncbi:MAG: cytochrome c [Bacteroidota bacterium]